MQTDNLLAQKIELELVFAEVWEAAEYMDAVDGGLLKVDPAEYRDAALLATEILRRYSCEKLDKLCQMSWALGEIQENLRFEKLNK